MLKSQKVSKTLKKILIVSLSACMVLLFAFTIASCGGSGFYTAQDSNSSVEVEKGDTIKVKLESNPTTGYCWNLTDDMDHSIVSLLSSEYKQSKKAKNLVGAGGFEYFTFKAESCGSTDIILNYFQPWEEDEEPAETFSLSVTVK